MLLRPARASSLGQVRPAPAEHVHTHGSGIGIGVGDIHNGITSGAADGALGVDVGPGALMTK